MIHEKDRVVCIRSGPQNVSDVIAVCMQRLNRDYAGQMIRSRCSGCAAKYGYEKGTCNGGTAWKHETYSFFLISLQPYQKEAF